MNIEARAMARALGGELSGGNLLVPGPGRSPADRSLSIKIDPAAPDGFIVDSFAGGAGSMRELQLALVPAAGDARAKLGKPRKSTTEIAMGTDE
jgi:hypothetical protein